MFTKIRQVNYAELKKIMRQGQKLRMISNIEATVCFKLPWNNRDQKEKRKKIHSCYGSGFSDTSVFLFQNVSANELQRARRTAIL